MGVSGDGTGCQLPCGVRDRGKGAGHGREDTPPSSVSSIDRR